MSRKTRVLPLTLAFVAAALAGCAGDDGPPTGGDGQTPPLRDGRGAISGLLIDDRFRPIQLVADGEPTGDFAAQGFILLQETGQRVRTNANGEFSFRDLEPGTYTLRPSVTGHEATSQRIEVRADEFSEVNVLARRIASAGGVVLTEEYTVFIPCSLAAAPVGWVTFNCVGDLSGDSFRTGISGIGYADIEDVSYLVAEMAANQEGNYQFTVREDDNTSFGGDQYGTALVMDTRYAKVILQNGADYQNKTDTVVWNNDKPMSALLFVSGILTEETCGIFCEEFGEFGAAGVGASVGIKAQIAVSVFLGEPDVDVATYCVLC